MINIYYGTAETDKDRFLFDRIADRMPADTILLVPDQFTLQAERNAFTYINTDTLLELEIMSRSGFIRRVESEAGRPQAVPVDKYGRYMLLAKILIDAEKENNESESSSEKEGIFASAERRQSFISLLNDQISELKQYNVTPDELESIAAEFDEEDIINAKLNDICRLYRKYEEASAGKFMDAEDYQSQMALRVYDAEFVKKNIFWIDEFDYMTPRMLELVKAAASVSPEINIVLTGAEKGKSAEEDELFALFHSMRRQLREIAEETGCGYAEYRIPDKYSLEICPETSVMAASDFYAEAESIAADIVKLVREKGIRYKDIVVICNDYEKRGAVFRRVFDLYRIPLFMDRKRSISQEPAVEFITSMIDIIRKNRRFDDVFRMIKTGFTPVGAYDAEKLEKYCRKYNIRSGNWKKEFIYGFEDEGEQAMAQLNKNRAVIDEYITAAEKIFKECTTVRDRCEALYNFLAGVAEMPARCETARMTLEEAGLLEAAECAGQIWELVVNILDQLVEVIGDEEISDEDFNEILRQGFDEVEIGLIPTNNDQVLFGTMQRTRTGRMKVMFVAGANEGVLPEAGRTEGLLSDDEKVIINEKLHRISKTDELRVMEQNLAIYKNMSKASDILAVSYSEIDTDGTELRKSEIVDRIERRDGTEIKRDYISSGNTEMLLQAPEAAAGHVTAAMRSYLDGEELDDIWKASAIILNENRHFITAREGLFYDGRTERIDRERVRQVFGRGENREIVLSASALERYSRCPFSFVAAYGLKPEEDRTFRVDMRSIGDIYHECMRYISESLSEEGVEIDSPESEWMNVTEEKCAQLVDECITAYAEEYREGVFNMPGREAYIRERIRDICIQTAWLMILQVRSGKVKKIYFEKRFGRHKDAVFPPIVLDLGEEGSVFIEGIIDRVDIIKGFDEPSEGDAESVSEDEKKPGGSSECGQTEKTFVKIIDYKSGNEEFDIEEVRSGWRLQLMIYLRGAMGGIEESRAAGVFYFSVKEKTADVSDVDDSEIAETVQERIIKSTRLDGILVKNNSVIESVDANIGSTSSVINVRKKKDGEYIGGALLSDAEFKELIEQNEANLETAGRNLLEGYADAAPKKSANASACTYCRFRSICGKENV